MPASVKSAKLPWEKNGEPWTTPNTPPDVVHTQVSSPSLEGGGEISVEVPSENRKEIGVPASSKKVVDLKPSLLPSGKTLEGIGYSEEHRQLTNRSALVEPESISDMAGDEPWTCSNISSINLSDDSDAAISVSQENNSQSHSRKEKESTKSAKLTARYFLVATSCLIGFLIGYLYWSGQSDGSSAQYQNNLKAMEVEHQAKLTQLQKSHLKEQAALEAIHAVKQNRILDESKKQVESESKKIEAINAEQTALIRSELVARLANKEQQLRERQRELRALLETEQQDRASDSQRYQSRIEELTRSEEKLREEMEFSKTQLLTVRSQLESLKNIEDEFLVLKTKNEQLNQKLAEQNARIEKANKQLSTSEAEQQQTLTAKIPEDQVASLRLTGSTSSSMSISPKPDLIRPSAEIVELFRRMESGKLTHLQRYLIKGGDPDVRNSNGEPLLVRATTLGYYIMVKELIRAGAKIDSADTMGRSALVHAVLANNPGVASLLVSHGASSDYVTHQGETPLGLATKSGLSELAAVLQAAQ